MILTEKFLLNSKNSKPFLLGIAYMPVFVLYSILRKAMGHYTLVKRNRFRLMANPFYGSVQFLSYFYIEWMIIK